MFSGLEDDIVRLSTDVFRRLNLALKDEFETYTKDKIMEAVSWSWKDDDESFKEYTREATVALENARQAGERIVDITASGRKYKVEISKGVQKGIGKAVREVKRELRNTDTSADLPLCWTDPEGRGHDYPLYKYKLDRTDREFRNVSDAFTSTGGTGSITSLERIQNPKMYRSYLNEKRYIAKTRSKEIVSGKAVLQVQGWHGTDAETIEHIITNGFNRSYSGKANAKYYGSGIYFANNAAYSCDPKYSRVDSNNEIKLLYCDVLLGMSTVGTEDMIEPPVINPVASLTDRYDSTTGKQGDHIIYISCYKDNRAYPTYLVTFT
ncbi:protein mono-ADP-ribosyltransferase PARP14-like [Corticium candelabrum]|uniref:protein mono-ADP-ribosyltransferase PARP14-like n=1 Tax=Corticium candelabrum TaxID=121492 RepID=UPI002E274A14|nr:protein mono-ADP-ribosyltransferase PARP14-like [Corticium candelabrum]